MYACTRTCVIPVQVYNLSTIHVNHSSSQVGTVEDSIQQFRGGNWRVPQLGMKSCVFTGGGSSGRVGSVFLRLRASIWESCQQKAHETVARAGFAVQHVRVRKSDGRSTFGRWSRKRCTGLSSISQKHHKQIEGIQVAPDVCASDFWSEMARSRWRVRALRGWNPVWKKRIGMAARRQVVTLLLCGIVAGGC